MNSKYYDVTKWKIGNPYDDIGQVINSIILDIKNNNDQGTSSVIYLPPGNYNLTTQVKIDISFLKIIGSGHGFISSSIRYNTPESETKNWHDIWPGGSRIKVNLDYNFDDEAAKGAAFYVYRDGNPRISSVEFSNFCIDGLHFTGSEDSENTYINGKTGIYVGTSQDSFRITEMGFVYLEHGIVCLNSDALTIHDNFIAECGNCIELLGHGQASSITNNFIGAGYQGYSIFVANYGGMLVSSNNVFPRGKSSLHLHNVSRSNVSSNRFHSFYPGMLILDGNCKEVLVSGNHFLRDNEPWKPMEQYNNSIDAQFGLIHIEGNHNSIIGNHISHHIKERYLNINNDKAIMININDGTGNYIANNHIVSTYEPNMDLNDKNSSCFSVQVDALLSNVELKKLPVINVKINNKSMENIVLDTGNQYEVDLDSNKNSFRPTPSFIKH